MKPFELIGRFDCDRFTFRAAQHVDWHSVLLCDGFLFSRGEEFRRVQSAVRPLAYLVTPRSVAPVSREWYEGVRRELLKDNDPLWRCAIDRRCTRTAIATGERMLVHAYDSGEAIEEIATPGPNGANCTRVLNMRYDADDTLWSVRTDSHGVVLLEARSTAGTSARLSIDDGDPVDLYATLSTTVFSNVVQLALHAGKERHLSWCCLHSGEIRTLALPHHNVSDRFDVNRGALLLRKGQLVLWHEGTVASCVVRNSGEADVERETSFSRHVANVCPLDEKTVLVLLSDKSSFCWNTTDGSVQPSLFCAGQSIWGMWVSPRNVVGVCTGEKLEFHVWDTGQHGVHVQHANSDTLGLTEVRLPRFGSETLE